MPATIFVHLAADAPDKPPPGAPCNGCGVCCSQDTCPLGRLRFWQTRGPCPALTWSASEKRYHCGLLTDTRRHLPFPAPLAKPLRRLIRRWIATGSGCDCAAQVADEKLGEATDETTSD